VFCDQAHPNDHGRICRLKVAFSTQALRLITRSTVLTFVVLVNRLLKFAIFAMYIKLKPSIDTALSIKLCSRSTLLSWSNSRSRLIHGTTGSLATSSFIDRYSTYLLEITIIILVISLTVCRTNVSQHIYKTFYLAMPVATSHVQIRFKKHTQRNTTKYDHHFNHEIQLLYSIAKKRRQAILYIIA
jgi:hypothetical protein